jgi:hypothetical protein
MILTIRRGDKTKKRKQKRSYERKPGRGVDTCLE